MSLSNLTNNQFSLSVDGLTELNTDILTVNGQSITGNYLNSNSNTANVNTVITLNTGSSQFTVKDTSNNELIKCDNATDITSFYRPQTSFTGQNTGNDIVNLTYGLNTYWFLSGSNNISGVFTMASAGAIWFKNSIGTTLLLMSGSGVNCNNTTLTGQTNLYTVFIASGGGNQLLMLDASGNIQNAFTLNYSYGDPNATIYTVVPSNISAQQQTLQWTRDFSVNSLYGWKLSSSTINKAPLTIDLPITIPNLYATTLVLSSSLTCSNVTSSTNILTLSNSVSDTISLDNGRIRFQGTGDFRILASPNRYNFNIPTGYQHSFSINDVQLFRFSNTAVPTITSNNSNFTLTTMSGGTLNLQNNIGQLLSNAGGNLTLNNFFTMSDSSGNQVYSNVIGIYTQTPAGSYSLISNSGSAFLVSSSGSVVALTNDIALTSNSGNVIYNGKLYSSNTNGNPPSVGQFGGLGDRLILYQGSASVYPLAIGIGSATLWYSVPASHIHNWYIGGNSIMNLQNSGNDTLSLSRTSNNPSVITGVGYFSYASSSTSWCPDSITNDTVIHNASGNIRFRTGAVSNNSNFIINSNGTTTVKNRTFQTHQFIITGQEFYQSGFSDTGVSLNCFVNRSGNKQLSVMDCNLALNSTNLALRFMPGNGSIDTISTDGNNFRTLTVAGSDLKFGFYTTNGNLTTSAGNGTVTVVSDKRLKRDIEYLTDTQEGLNAILNLKPCKFKLINDKSNAVYQGFIADDMMKYIPYAVDGKKIEYKWKTDISGNMELDEKGEIIYELDENGDKKIRPKAITDIAVVASMTLGIQELYKLFQHQQNVINNQKNDINDYKDKVNHLLITQDNLTKQIIDITNNLNKITEKLISITNK